MAESAPHPPHGRTYGLEIPNDDSARVGLLDTAIAIQKQEAREMWVAYGLIALFWVSLMAAFLWHRRAQKQKNLARRLAADPSQVH